MEQEGKTEKGVGDSIKDWTELKFNDSVRAVESRLRWIRFIEMSSMVLRRP